MKRAKGLFRSCENWEYGNCKKGLSPEVFHTTSGVKTGQADGAQLTRELNKLCLGCRNPLQIRDKKCPACLSTDLRIPDIYLIEVDSLRVYNFVCQKCGRELYLYRVFDAFRSPAREAEKDAFPT
jgi:hypothetical protein